MKGFRTVVFNIIMFLLGLLEHLDATDFFENEGWIVLATAAGNFLLRLVTDTKVFKSS